MFTDEESSDVSALSSEDFPFSVGAEILGSKTAEIVLCNKRDVPIVFKCLVLDPDNLSLNPVTGRVHGTFNLFYM